MSEVIPISGNVFLSAEWRYLAMLNYAIDPAVLRPLVPPGTELDEFEGVTYASVVGFHFCRTRVLGIAFPFHRDFEEVNLRFYVRRRVEDGWRRGVVFVRELVPRFAIAFIARTLYGEPYLSLPMRHEIRRDEAGVRVRYEWRRRGEWESVTASAAGLPEEIEAGSLCEFITEHYWGYTGRRGGCSEYQVEHPRWRAWTANEYRYQADVRSLYGDAFVESLLAAPASAFIAEGSPVLVRRTAALC